MSERKSCTETLDLFTKNEKSSEEKDEDLEKDLEIGKERLIEIQEKIIMAHEKRIYQLMKKVAPYDPIEARQLELAREFMERAERGFPSK